MGVVMTWPMPCHGVGCAHRVPTESGVCSVVCGGAGVTTCQPPRSNAENVLTLCQSERWNAGNFLTLCQFAHSAGLFVVTLV